MYNFEKIPTELKEQKRWVLWKKKITDNGKTTKIPVCAYSGYGAKSNDSSTWATFEEASAKIRYYNCEGLGFMLGNGYFGVDIDHELENEELINKFINTLKSYTELSQSGQGIHIICKGNLPNGARRKGNIEMYDSARFFVMTGNQIGNYSIEDRTQEIISLWKEYVSEEKDGLYVFKRESYRPKDIQSLTDNEVIKLAKESKTGRLFDMLYNGEWQGMYPSQSEADMALCSQLAFWTARDGTQMDRIFRSSGLYREKWDKQRGATTYGEATINEAIRVCTDVYIPPKKEKSVVKTDTFSNSKSYDLNDTGNAQRFIDRFGDVVRYNHDNKNWLLWDNKTWVKDPKQLIKTKVDILIEEMKEEANKVEEPEVKKALLQNIKHLSSNSGKEAMLKEAMHIGKVATINADFDNNKYLLNCDNGVVDLKTGQLLPHNKDYMMSKNTHIEVDLENEPTIWLKCVNDIFKNSKGLVDFVHKAVGYSLTGDVKEQCFFQCYGNGSNGKSVFFNTLYNMLGDYVVNAQVESVLSRGGSMGGNANPDIARLKGARFVRTNEPNENARFNEGLVKQLTGGDPITARYLYGSEFEFKPVFKLWIASNHKINVVGTDKGIWRRMRLVPFEACFEGENNDKNIEEKLLNELPQILGWAVKGCIKWQQDGLEPPEEVKEATDTYRTEMDIIEKFVSNCCKLSPNGKEKSGDLFEEYVEWAKKSNEFNKLSQTKFGLEMAKKYNKVKINGYVYYTGIILNKHDTSYVYTKEK